MAIKAKLPMGIENFKEIREAGFYYVDKTGLIKDLLENWGKVNLFTRSGRFGKTLNISMLKCLIELLIGGGSIKKEIKQELTYRDLDSSFDNLWSILFTTGYLTQRGKDAEGRTELIIPNREVRMIFIRQIQEWFKEETAKDSGRLESFCRAFLENNVSAIEEGFTSYLKKNISIRDAMLVI